MNMSAYPITRLVSFAALAVSACFSTSSFAAASWNFSNCNSSSNFGSQSGAGTYGNSWSCADNTGNLPNNTNTVTVTAFGGSSTVAGFTKANVSNQGSSGFGISAQHENWAGSPNHAADNNPLSNVPDLFLLEFDNVVTLDSVRLGWVGRTNSNGTSSQRTYDADFTLMAYNGGGAPTILGNTASNLTSGGIGAGWDLIQDVTGAYTSSVATTKSVNGGATPVASSWWIISAYNSNYNNSTADASLDYFKLFSVSSSKETSRAPEPGTLALLGVAMTGMVAIRRRQGTLNT